MTKARDIASAAPAPSTVSATELGFVDGVTSAIQTQLDAKAPSSTAVTLTGTQTLTNKTLTSPTTDTATHNNSLLKSPEERFTVSATAATGTVSFDTQTQGVLYCTTNASGNFVLNFTNVNANLATGDAITCIFLNTNGGTAFYATSVQVDGTTRTVKYSGGTAPAAGNANSIDAYSFTLIKTADATFTILGAGAVKYA